jgi:PAS domain S-box-containing protein
MRGHPRRGTMAEVSSAELDRRRMACDFPLFVWDPPQGVVRLTNQAAADLTGRALGDVIGLHLFDLVDPREAVEQVVAGLGSGVIDAVQTVRQIRRVDGSTVPVVIWSRVFDLDERRVVVSLVVPVNEIERLGRDQSMPWRDLASVAVGTADREWRVQRVSADGRDIMGQDPRNWEGSSILDRVHPDDVAALLGPDSLRSGTPSPRCHVRFAHGRGEWIEVGFLFAHLGGDSGQIVFAVVGTPEIAPAPTNRVAELERRLRHIGAEVRASGVLTDFEGIPAPSDHPQLGELTSRQWDILSRILRGERVPTIARALYLSPSTVRNHLTAIFRKFGVHSQSELMVLLLPRSDQEKHPA